MRKALVLTLVLVLVAALCVPAMAETATPSVTQKAAPEVVTPASGIIAEVIVDGVVTYNVVSPTDIVITPVSEAANNPRLANAYAEVIAAASVGDLPSATVSASGEQLTVADEINAQLTASGKAITADKLVVRDMFDLNVSDAYMATVNQANGALKLTLKTDLKPEDTLVVMVCGDDGKWTVVPAENVVINADGTVTITFPVVGTVAFLTEKAE